MNSEESVRRMDASDDVPVVDWNSALERVGGSVDALQELVELFRQDECPRLTQEIRDAFVNEDAEQMERAAHTLKSSADLFGAPTAFDAARKLEGLAKESDFPQATQMWKTLEQELAILCTALASRENR